MNTFENLLVQQNRGGGGTAAAACVTFELIDRLSRRSAASPPYFGSFGRRLDPGISALGGPSHGSFSTPPGMQRHSERDAATEPHVHEKIPLEEKPCSVCVDALLPS